MLRDNLILTQFNQFFDTRQYVAAAVELRRLYDTGDLLPEQMLKALARQDKMGSPLAVRILRDDRQIDGQGFHLFKILDKYVDEKVPAHSILDLFTIHSDIGGNIFHEIAYGGDLDSFLSWLNLLSKMARAAEKEDLPRVLDRVYQILKQESCYYSNINLRHKPIDMLNPNRSNIHTYLAVYADIILELKSLGLKSEQVTELLKKEGRLISTMRPSDDMFGLYFLKDKPEKKPSFLQKFHLLKDCRVESRAVEQEEELQLVKVLGNK